jgi:hypothetical protein
MEDPKYFAFLIPVRQTLNQRQYHVYKRKKAKPSKKDENAFLLSLAKRRSLKP